MILAHLSAAPGTSFPAPQKRPSLIPHSRPSADRRVGLELEPTPSHRAGALLALSRACSPVCRGPATALSLPQFPHLHNGAVGAPPSQGP